MSYFKIYLLYSLRTWVGKHFRLTKADYIELSALLKNPEILSCGIEKTSHNISKAIL